MDYLECISRYRTARPLTNESSLHPPAFKVFRRSNIQRTYSTCMLFLALILVCNVCPHTREAHATHDINYNNLPSANLDSKLWPSISLAHEIGNLAADDHNGSVYITDDSGNLYTLNENLNLALVDRLLSSSTGANLTLSDLHDQQNSNNLQPISKILMIVQNQNLDWLLSCWQVIRNDLRCRLYKIPINYQTNKVSFGDVSLPFKSYPGDLYRPASFSSSMDNFLLIKSRFLPTRWQQPGKRLDIDVDPLLPPIGRFNISYHRETRQFILGQKSVLSISSHLGKDDLFYDYIYEFSYHNYTYFLLNDMRLSRDQQGSNLKRLTKLARVCNSDIDLYSYTEILISCEHLGTDGYMRAAHFDSDDRLFIVFEKEKANGIKSESKLCIYAMPFVEDRFYSAVADCQNGHVTAQLLAKFHPEADRPPLCSKNPSTDWCLSKVNQYIDGSASNLTQDESIDTKGIKNVEFIYSVSQGDSDRALFFGTNSGYLTKMHAQSEDLLFTIDLRSNDISYHPKRSPYFFKEEPADFGVSTNKQAKYLVRSNKIIAYTRIGNVSIIDVNSCHYYSSCSECRIDDPLKCVWCSGSCVRLSDCPAEQISERCPPIIKSFKPESGPLTGSTKIEIRGQNFGSNPAKIVKLKLGEENCDILADQTKRDVIYCLNKNITRPSNLTFSLTVYDDIPASLIDGTAVTEKRFFYEDVEVYGVDPEPLPARDEIRFVVHGKNLHIGTNRTVYLNDTQGSCVDESKSSSTVECYFKYEFPQSYDKEDSVYLLKYLIDGSPQKTVKEHNGAIGRIMYLTVKNQKTSNITDQDIATTQTHTEPITNSQNETSRLNIVVISIVLLVAIIIVIYLASIDKKGYGIKLKIPSLTIAHKEDRNETGVTFRNPESRQFIGNNQLNPGDESIHDLIKMNGLASSSDYFSGPVSLKELVDKKHSIISEFLDNETMERLEKDGKLIDRKNLFLRQVIGQGNFGKVHKGYLKSENAAEIDVAVKTLKTMPTWDMSSEIRDFLEEGLMMQEFHHENVLELIGLTFDSDGLPMVITPFMQYGDLKTYISDDACEPTVKDLIDFGVQIARGMAYLSNSRFVHRDLAARNCMLTKSSPDSNHLTVKVADFGLSRDIYESDYYCPKSQGKLPVRWMAVESLERRLFTTKTDVWSYGVVLWELMTRGVLPYPEVDNMDLFAYLRAGRRMLRPKYCPVILYKIMLSCWQESPAQRPTFDELVVSVSNVIQELQTLQVSHAQQRVSRDEVYSDEFR